jgi:putative flippase GtrA
MTPSESLKIRRVFTRNPIDTGVVALASRFGSRSREAERFLKFALVGFLGAVIDAGTLFMLQATVLAPVEPNIGFKVALASSIAFFLAVCSNFYWNRVWTYPDSRSRSVRRQLAQFTMISVVGWLGRTVWISLSYRWLGEVFMPVFLPEIQLIRPGYVPSVSAEAKLGTMIAWGIGVIIVLIWNFLANRYWTYGDVD